MQHIYTCTCERSVIEIDKRETTQDNFIDALFFTQKNSQEWKQVSYRDL